MLPIKPHPTGRIQDIPSRLPGFLLHTTTIHPTTPPNHTLQDAGANTIVEQRITDMDIETCKKRYAIFRSHYSATLRLKRFFPFHLIDAMGTVSETQVCVFGGSSMKRPAGPASGVSLRQAPPDHSVPPVPQRLNPLLM